METLVQKEPPPPLSYRPRPGVTVLVVDDDQVLLGALKRRLERFGCVVTACSTVGDALGLLSKQPFEVVLTDLRIGEESGLSLLRAIRQAYPNTGALLMSGDALRVERQEALALGARAVLAKPFSVSELDDALERALAGREAGPS